MAAAAATAAAALGGKTSSLFRKSCPGGGGSAPCLAETCPMKDIGEEINGCGRLENGARVDDDDEEDAPTHAQRNKPVSTYNFAGPDRGAPAEV